METSKKNPTVYNLFIKYKVKELKDDPVNLGLTQQEILTLAGNAWTNRDKMKKENEELKLKLSQIQTICQ